MRNHNLSLGLLITASVFVILFLCRPVAHAYIDPGTGSVIYTSIAAMIGIGAGVLGAILWPLRRLIQKIRRRSNDSDDSDS